MTWNDTSLALDNILIEGNWSGSAVNYTMSNATYGGDIYNYSRVIGAGTWFWLSCANNTDDNWNCTDKWTFTISQNSSNPVHTNITLEGVSTTDGGITSYSDKSITLDCYSDYSSAGTDTLFVDGVSKADPTTQTWGVGTYTVKCNKTGNANYTANSTGFSVSMVINTPPNPGGGGGGGTVELPTAGDFNVFPSERIVGVGLPETLIRPAFTVNVYNGNASQSYYLEFSEELLDYCELKEFIDAPLPPGGYGKFVFECFAPNGTAEGQITVKATGGAFEKAIPVSLIGGSDIWVQFNAFFGLLMSNPLEAFLMPFVIFGWQIPAWSICLLAGVIMVAVFKREEI